MSTSPMGCKDRFYNLLEDVFIGVPVEGQSGYINLMRIKQQYYRKVMVPHLESYVAEQLQNFPHFQEEMYDKLYTFFRRYFSDNGSLGLFFTPYHESVYERVYTDDRDVMLFYKTHRLYYVKTDRLFRNMDVEVDGYTFRFDVSGMEHKKANEKRELAYHLDKNDQGNVILLRVSYKEGNSKTDIQGICKRLKQERGMKVSEETLEKAISKFERQSEMDYFICKDAKSFLREQFDLWMWQYLLGQPNEEPVDVFTQHRLDQLQALKRVAYCIIDFIAAFEDELVKIWNKPRFVLNSNYVITIDRIWAKSPDMVHRLLHHSGMEKQVQEWRELGMVGNDFQPQHILNSGNLIDHLHPRYRFLPVDTKYFKDMELDILGLFDNLDEELDGWLIKSENYQALNTMLPKFREQVKCIYIDPPYNTGSDEFIYEDRIQHSSWLTMVENRLMLAKELMSREAALLVHIDENEQPRLRILLETIFGSENYLAPMVWIARAGKGGTGTKIQISHEHIEVTAKDKSSLSLKPVERVVEDCPYNDERGAYKRELLRQWGGQHDRREDRPSLYFPIPTPFDVKVYPKRPDGTDGTWRFSRDKVMKMLEAGDIDFVRDEETGEITVYRKIRAGQKVISVPSNLLNDVGSSADGTKAIKALFGEKVYDTSKPVALLERLIDLVCWQSPDNAVILDFFAGSGTTGHAVINMNREDGGRRKYILVEMADYFYKVLLPRIKKVVFSDEWKDGKAQPNGRGISHFVKYYELEQYEDALRLTRYLDDGLSALPHTEDPCQYLFLRDPKMLDNAETEERVLEVDTEHNVVRVDLSRIYQHIDLAETLSNLTGKWIKRVVPDPEDPARPGTVEFADGTTVDLKNPDWRLIKPLIWW